jgi:hypothetical protein
LSLFAPIKPAFRAVLANWKPMLLIQVCAAAIVIAYYQSSGMQSWCAGLADIKTRGGLVFSAVVGALAGGILPEIAKIVTGERKKVQSWREVLCVSFYFACMGVSIDIMYAWFGRVYGMGHEPVTVLKKTASDMGVFCPLIAVPTSVLLFTWKDRNFSWSSVKSALSGGGFLDLYVKMILPNWIMWIPVLGAVYALPVNLQFLMAELAEAAWSILVVHISQGANEA